MEVKQILGVVVFPGEMVEISQFKPLRPVFSLDAKTRLPLEFDNLWFPFILGKAGLDP
jgi:hypothetical protein